MPHAASGRLQPDECGKDDGITAVSMPHAASGRLQLIGLYLGETNNT